MNFVFKIFGAPYGFDLYQVTESEQNYFQTLDDGSKEKSKLTIRRMANGRVLYSYLRYKFITSGGRGNSFFGMSIMFNKEYCADVENLYKLFEAVYQTILQNKILFEEIEGSADAQAKYLVSKFSEAESEVKRIENVVSKNLVKAFADDIRPLDASFKQDVNLDKVMLLNNEAGNATFLSALKDFPLISISSAFSGGIVKKVPQKQISDLVAYQKKIEQEGDALKTECKVFVNSFSALSAFSDVEKKNRLKQISPQYNNAIRTIDDLLDKCDAVQRKVIEYQKIEPKLRTLIEVSQRADTLKKELENEREAFLPFGNAIQQAGMSGTSVGIGAKPPKPAGNDTDTDVKPPDGDKGGRGPQPPTERGWLEENKPKIFGVLGVLVLVVMGAWWFFGIRDADGGNKPNENIVVVAPEPEQPPVAQPPAQPPPIQQPPVQQPPVQQPPAQIPAPPTPTPTPTPTEQPTNFDITIGRGNNVTNVAGRVVTYTANANQITFRIIAQGNNIRGGRWYFQPQEGEVIISDTNSQIKLLHYFFKKGKKRFLR